MMTHRTLYRVAVFALTAISSAAGHEGGDYLVQRDCDAQRKQQRTPEGRKALAVHASTYALTQAATKAAAYRTAGVRVPLLAQIAGTAVEGALHAIIDDGRLLRRFADTTGKDKFHDLGAPRQVTAVTASGERVHLVATDENNAPVVNRDENGSIVDCGPFDNPSPATGRALMDQGVHKSLQIPIGAIVTTAVAAWLRR